MLDYPKQIAAPTFFPAWFKARSEDHQHKYDATISGFYEASNGKGL